ncbi:glycosyl hydrolase family 18 (putative chitinase) [Krasilnikovia cinnamomea]|uniref:Glycosyl hydrolase family 18 (Putative chitinase) n=2 Tax=Krasilnikovia cinnamomea TaxID=349313 RepID=A0A4Q7ZGV2_9ACTN|nr:glycosyl hydrolase family 18 protein [Krasilnikovia cinnamomea]RZU49998.1 glycosyl hydrolase family 18 (putative chitinase) [Krasilnikovia cinnamomea]
MKPTKRYVAIAGVLLAGLAAAILPMAASNAAVACAPAWSSSAVYVKDNQASQNGHNYTAKWWTQNESPATHSGQWDVWIDNGACGGGTPDPTPTNPIPSDPPPGGTKMAAAPYIYPGWGNPPAPSTVVNATGIKSFTIAFVLANGCNPAWDGESGLTGGVHESTINAIKAAGATVVPSIGGWSGNKLGPNCPTAEALAGAYQKVIDTFGLKSIDIDIENTDEFENTVVQDRILDALKIIKTRNPSVKTILTFGTSTTGPTYYGTRLVQQAKAKNAGIDIFTQMPFDFGGGADMYASTVNASEGLKNLLKSTFGWSDAQAYAHMGISGMNGLSDQQELTSPATWTKIRDYARSKGLARFSFWAVNRDRGCPGGGVVSHCSGIAQADWEFTKISAGF